MYTKGYIHDTEFWAFEDSFVLSWNLKSAPSNKPRSRIRIDSKANHQIVARGMNRRFASCKSLTSILSVAGLGAGTGLIF
jgi:hypothetical protein